MWIAFLVTQLMMNPMRRDPENRPAFERQCGADTHQVFDPLWRLISAMRQQTVVAHADPDIDCKHIKDRHDRQTLPGEKEERGECTGVEEDNRDHGEPVDAGADRGSATHPDQITGCNRMTLSGR